jgi:hypothetical protein
MISVAACAGDTRRVAADAAAYMNFINDVPIQAFALKARMNFALNENKLCPE